MGRQLVRVALLVAVAAALAGQVALAEVSTERSASIVVFPKVIADGTRDTIIQLGNTSNSLVRAHCFYVNAAPRDSSRDPDPIVNPPLWQEIDFDILLTRQQPTHWVVSRGRRVNPLDQACSADNLDCDNAGFDPGLIPPVLPDFVGELKCVEVDDGGSPLSGNHLKGEATLIAQRPTVVAPYGTPAVLLPGDPSKYNAIGIQGVENNGDGTLVLGGGQCVGAGDASGAVCTGDADCGDAGPCAPEYDGCPDTWILNHTTEGAPDLVLEEAGAMGTSAVDTELTVVPCTQNFETQEFKPSKVTLQFRTTNEFESTFSMSTTVQCWGNFSIDEIGGSFGLTLNGTPILDPQGTMFLETRIRSAGDNAGGVLMVGEEFHTGRLGTIGTTPVRLASPAASNLHVEGQAAGPDVITIPAEQIAP